MNIRRAAIFGLQLIVFGPSVAYSLNNLPTTGALPDTVHLMKDCGTEANCATTLNEINNWITNYKQPSSVSPLVVRVGPGLFGGGFRCDGMAAISLQGSGPGVSIIRSGTNALFARNCDQLNVQDITFMPHPDSGSYAPVTWHGTGSSTWTNVHIDADHLPYGWEEGSCPSDPDLAPVHYWFGSRIQGQRIGYYVQCSKNWFFSSQISAKPSNAQSHVVGLAVGIDSGTNASMRPEVHIYGSNVSVALPAGVTFPAAGQSADVGVNVISAQRNAEVHIHGTGIDLIGNDEPNIVAALAASPDASIHADQTAFNLRTGMNGAVIRIFNPGGHSVHAPYMWHGHATPPLVRSVTGADTTIVTATSDGRPHLVVYDSSCASGWYDTDTKICYE